MTPSQVAREIEDLGKTVVRNVFEDYGLSTKLSDRVYANSIEDVCRSITKLLTQAISEEREACAKVAHSYLNAFDIPKEVDIAEWCKFHKEFIAQEIRNRNNLSRQSEKEK